MHELRVGGERNEGAAVRRTSNLSNVWALRRSRNSSTVLPFSPEDSTSAEYSFAKAATSGWQKFCRDVWRAEWSIAF